MKQIALASLLLLTSSTLLEAKCKIKKCKKSAETATVEVTKKDTLEFKTRADTVSYFLGLQIGEDMKKNGATDINPKILEKGFSDVLNGLKSPIDQQTGMMYAQSKKKKKQAIQKTAEATKSKLFFDALANNPKVITTPSGLRYEILKDTTGQKPKATDKVSVHYTGSLINGTIFDSSEGGEPVSFPLNQVIKGWTEGVQLMSVGSKYKFYVPGNLAYGEQGVPQVGIGPNETLIFTVELLSIEAPLPQVPQAPTNTKIK